MTVLSTPDLELSIRNWLAISFSGGVYRPKFEIFFSLKKKHRLLRCSLLSKLGIWKRIVELVLTCSLWLLHTLSLGFFHVNTRGWHIKVLLRFWHAMSNFTIYSAKWFHISQIRLWYSCSNICSTIVHIHLDIVISNYKVLISASQLYLILHGARLTKLARA